MTVDVIKSIKIEELLEDPHCLLRDEFSTLANATELTGGRVSMVYKVNHGGEERVLKASMGLYRMTELKREAEVINDIINFGCGHLVPKIFEFKVMKKYAYLIEEYIAGESVREKLKKYKSKEERFEIWKGLGKALSELHKLYQQDDLESRWLNDQLDLARINMQNNLLDIEEFKEETPEEMLKWLNSNNPKPKKLTLIHGDYRTKNIIIDNQMRYKVIDWGFVDIGDSYYDLAIMDCYFNSSEDRDSFYAGYKEKKYNKELIEYYDKLSKFTNV